MSGLAGMSPTGLAKPHREARSRTNTLKAYGRCGLVFASLPSVHDFRSGRPAGAPPERLPTASFVRKDSYSSERSGFGRPFTGRTCSIE
jgi:hypothetical protein